MPCYDPYTPEQKISYINGVDPEKVAQETRRANKAEAMLCALMSELVQLGHAEAVMATASRHGLVDLMDFWNKHRADDKSRLAKELHKYSVDEQRIILELLQQGTKHA